ncbi:hypothetical protein EJC47_15315 [Sphingomonas sp. TF3]|uniref:Uncharacterized protein n=1 Tax=Sphingomonas echinoides TaxID=59803 RepID=A0ABU4PR67_9SPHN|nr:MULTISPECIES: hypothetical protein [Sphingomonas]MDX5985613.1 hypothetical protein [Sphingomonas echinoides]RUN75709.1 hypothetical protein EJC47_15315 [Sphingomonas sp. TF3]
MLFFALLLQASTPPPAPLVSNQGQEVVDLFGSMCVETALKPTKAHIFDGQPETARSMTPDELNRVAPGAAATEGWIVRSPHDAWAALWFAPGKQTCGVTVRAADPTGMEAALNARLKTFYDSMGMQLSQRPDEISNEGGVTVHRASWTIDIGTHQLAVIASFAEKPIGAQQHLMTITMLR